MNGKHARAGNGAETRGTEGTETAVATAPRVNVNPVERVSSVALGGLLLVRGLRRPPIALAGGVLIYRGISGHSHLYNALGVKTTGGGHPEAGASADAPAVQRSITIGKPADELYQAWREPRNLSQIMGHFAEVSEAGNGRMRWTMHAVPGRTLEWDAETVEDRPGEFLRWQSLPGAALPNEGSVRFRPAPRDWGTEVTLRFRFDPPGGRVGKAVMKVIGPTPRLLTMQALRRFKSLVETGEIPTLEDQPAARKGGRD